MEVTIQPEREDYIAFFRYNIFIKKLAIRIVIAFYLSALLQAFFNHLFSIHSQSKTINTLSYLASFVIVAILFFFVPYFVTLLKFKKRLAVDNKLTEEKYIILTSDGVRVVSDHDNSFWQYSSIRDIGISAKFVYIVMFGRGLYVIPIRSFGTQSEASNFYSVIKQELARVKASGNYKNPQRLYNWGWLGLLPNFGAICGIILLYKGLVQYKDRKLALIGAADIAITVCFLTFINFYFNSPVGRSGYKIIAQSQLNGLVKSIEFYKMQHGVYPDSLQEIIKDDKFTPIYDPLPKVKVGGKLTSYQYWKIGNKYTLFSVGVDAIPLTDDDIYPTTGMGDTAKFGLIKAR